MVSTFVNRFKVATKVKENCSVMVILPVVIKADRMAAGDQ